KPTYGSVSRYGLIDMCMSFDQIGPIAKNVSDAALLLSVIYGKDECDAISQEGTPQVYTKEVREPANAGPEKSSTKIFTRGINLKNINQIPKKLKVGILDFPIRDERIQELVEEKIKKASEKYNWTIQKIKIPYLDLAVATYFPIVYVEFFSATRKFDGRRYGKRIEEVCGPEVLRRILGGSEISKAEHKGRYYSQALKVRKLIQEEFRKAFEKVDCIISPVVPRLPHKIGEKISSEEMFQYDALTCPMNLAGNCAVSLPCGEIRIADAREGKRGVSGNSRGDNGKESGISDDVRGVPVGMQIACDKFCDEKMLQIARAIEKVGE
ncbi:hypothetical protein J4474_01865, partial [Candidatus Pacearchaeota archaeon]|nr:hypothetical protein [Candidatus Pacearchaeota archaeon]